jgi:hypothetical protein
MPNKQFYTLARLSDNTISKLKAYGIIIDNAKSISSFSRMIAYQTRINGFDVFIQKIDQVLGLIGRLMQGELLINSIVFGLAACDTFDDPEKFIKFIDKFKISIHMNLKTAVESPPISFNFQNISTIY